MTARYPDDSVHCAVVCGTGTSHKLNALVYILRTAVAADVAAPAAAPVYQVLCFMSAVSPRWVCISCYQIAAPQRQW